MGADWSVEDWNYADLGRILVGFSINWSVKRSAHQQQWLPTPTSTIVRLPPRLIVIYNVIFLYSISVHLYIYIYIAIYGYSCVLVIVVTLSVGSFPRDTCKWPIKGPITNQDINHTTVYWGRYVHVRLVSSTPQMTEFIVHRFPGNS